jgi:pimeloyl-ACP methyl ester carboxylesterase
MTETIELQGTRLEIEWIPGPRHKPVLVFLHEGLGSVAMWTQRQRHWPRELCAAADCAGLLYSRRGYGQSDPIPDVRGPHRASANPLWPHGRHTPHYMHHEAQEVLPRLRVHLGLDQVILVGHSDGATIALLHAALCPMPTQALVLMAPHLFVEPMTIAAIEQARLTYEHAPTSPSLRQRLARFHANVDNAFWQWCDVWLSPDFAEFDIRAICQTIACPILALQGMNDAYGTLAQLKSLPQQNSATQWLTMEHCGHSPHRDQPDTLSAHVLAFLSRLSR